MKKNVSIILVRFERSDDIEAWTEESLDDFLETHENVEPLETQKLELPVIYVQRRKMGELREQEFIATRENTFINTMRDYKTAEYEGMFTVKHKGTTFTEIGNFTDEDGDLIRVYHIK